MKTNTFQIIDLATLDTVVGGFDVRRLLSGELRDYTFGDASPIQPPALPTGLSTDPTQPSTSSRPMATGPASRFGSKVG